MADILALALLAIDDPDAGKVLLDACLESGPSWSVDIEMPRPTMRNIRGEIVGWSRGYVSVTVGDQSFRWGFGHVNDDMTRGGAGPGDPEMLALAAVLLFGEWDAALPLEDADAFPRHPWPVVRRALEPLFADLPRVGTREHFRYVVREAAAAHGYRRSEVEVSSTSPGTVVAQIGTHIPEAVLAVMRQEIENFIPAHVHLQLESLPPDDNA